MTVSSEFSVISAEFQTQHCAAFHVRFERMSLRHQVCLVRLHDVMHEHVLHHYMFIRPKSHLDAHAFAD